LAVDKTSPPTVWANNAGEFIRRYSPVVVCNGSSGEFIRRYSPGVKKTSVSPRFRWMW
jgi:hypothetical protein